MSLAKNHTWCVRTALSKKGLKTVELSNHNSGTNFNEVCGNRVH